ncbi:MAG: ABC transporter substrate-binding protein [Burkholderiales bacterium]|nr:ABC transporter substrate-binding protein [Burkholderiales bacterium]
MLKTLSAHWALAMILGCACAANAQSTEIRVGYVANIAASPLNVADSLGFWKDLGLQVKLQAFDDSKSEVKALTNGDVDVALGIVGDFVGWQIGGAPIKLTAETSWSNGSAKILLKPGIDAAHLAGQSVGIGYHETGLDFFLGRYLNANGLRIADVKLQEGGGDQILTQFQNGQLAAVVLADPDATQARQFGNIAVDSATYEGLVENGFATSNAALGKIPNDAWVRFYKGWIKSVNWLRGGSFSWAAYRKTLDPVAYKKVLANGDAANVDSFNSVKFPNVAESMRQHGQLGGLEYHVRAVLRFMQEAGQIKTEPEARPLIQSAAFERALKEFK